MIDKGIESGFSKVYYVMKMSLLFWGLSFCGGLLFGVLPAILAISDLHQEANFSHKELTWKRAFASFKVYFLQGNSLLLAYGITTLLLLWSLFLSSQIQGFGFLLIDFLLIFALVLVSCSFLLILPIVSIFEIPTLQSIKLSLILFFTHFKASFQLFFGTVFLLLITYRFPGMILFVSVGLFVWLNQKIGQKVVNTLEIKA